MVLYQIEVAGMSCRGCEREVHEVVSALSTVGAVSPNHVEGRVFVQGDAGRDAHIRRAISEAGYIPVR